MADVAHALRLRLNVLAEGLVHPREKPSAHDHGLLRTALDEIERLQAAVERRRAEIAGLKDPAIVWANMLRGEIARPRALDHYEELKAVVERLNGQLDEGARWDEQREEWLVAALSAITDGDKYAALPAQLRDWYIGRRVSEAAQESGLTKPCNHESDPFNPLVEDAVCKHCGEVLYRCNAPLSTKNSKPTGEA